MKAYELLCNISKIYQNLISGTPFSRGLKIGFVCTKKRRVTSDKPLFALLKCKYTVIIQDSYNVGYKSTQKEMRNI